MTVFDADNLGDAAHDMLLNAEARAGGRIGIGSPDEEEQVHDLLRDAGFLSVNNRLTKAGADKARALQQAYWG